MADESLPPDEDAAWFAGLPEAEQQRLRGVWAAREERLRLDAPWHRREQNRRSVSALLTFAAVGVLGGASIWLALGAGVLCAVWWRHLRPSRMVYPVTAVTCFFVVHATSAAVRGAVSPAIVFDSLLLTALAALVGFQGEIRSSGGFVDSAPPAPPAVPPSAP